MIDEHDPSNFGFQRLAGRVEGYESKGGDLLRIDRAALGNFSDCKSVGDGVYEMRIHTGPGYRLYYVQRGKTVYLLLCGGRKGSQVRDIKKAKQLALEV